MAIRKQLYDVLALTAELIHNNVRMSIITLVIHRMGVPEQLYLLVDPEDEIVEFADRPHCNISSLNGFTRIRKE